MKHKKFNEYFTYILVDGKNDIVYAGYTANPDQRLKGHLTSNRSKFYCRKDVTMHIQASYRSKREAIFAENRLQKLFFPNTETDLEKMIRGCKKAGSNTNHEGRRKGGLKTAGKGFRIIAARVYKHSCGRIIKNCGASAWHSKNCGCERIEISKD